MITCRDITVRVGSKALIERVSFQADKGERLALTGPSGAGKTTLLRALAGLNSLDEGEILIDSQLASSGKAVPLLPHKRRIAMVAQDPGLWPNLSALAHLKLGGHDTTEALAMLERLGLEQAAKRKPGQLSGGERQRVALGIALMSDPKVLLLDEPFTALDLVRTRELVDLVNDFVTTGGATLICSTHQPEDAQALHTTRLLVLESSQLHADLNWPNPDTKATAKPSPTLRAWQTSCS